MLLIDTETFNIEGKRYIWEFAGLDIKTGKVFSAFHGANIRKALNAKCQNKSLMFFNRWQLKHASLHKWLEQDDFSFQVQECLQNYKQLIAYNISFDVKVLESCGFLLSDYKLMDLWGWSVQTFAGKKYVEFCNRHNFLTKTKLPKTDAETMHKFLSGNISFVSPHLALHDVIYEYDIYKHCEKRKTKKYWGCFNVSALRQVFITN